MRTFSLPFVGLLALVAPSVAHTSGSNEAPAPAHLPLSTSFEFDEVLYDSPTEGVLWARGRTYKARFAADGVTYIPFLGSDAPRNFPMSLALEAGKIGERALPLDAHPTIRRTGDRVVIDRGALLEVYDLAPESIEQSFHLSQRGSTGELTLSMRVESELHGAPEGRAWRFEGPSGGVRYGEAFAFDEAGTTALVESRLDGTQLELRVPDAFAATGTLVVDPVISTFGGITGPTRTRRADAAYNKDDLGGQCYVVYEQEFSSTDTDVFGVDLTSHGVLSNQHSLDITSEIWVHPKVACLNGSNSFMVVAETHASAGVNGRIKGRVRQGTGTNIGGAVTLNGSPGSFDCIHPDIGADSRSVAGGRYLVCWESRRSSGGDIHGRQFFATGLAVTPEFSISSQSSRDEMNPAVSNSAGQEFMGTPTFNIVWEEEVSSTNHDLFGAQITADGFLAEARFPIDTTVRHTTQPSVSATSPLQMADGQQYYAVAYITENTVGSDVWVAACSGRNVGRRRDLSLLEYDRVFTTHTDPEIVCAGDEFVVAYSCPEDGGSGDLDVLMASFAFVNAFGDVDVALSERGQLIADSHNDERRPALISFWDSGDFTSGEAFCVYDSNPSGGTAFTQVGAAFVRAWSAPRPIGAQYCSAEYNASGRRGWLAAYGTQGTLGNKVFIANDLPPFAFGYIIVSLDRGVVPNAGGGRGTLCLSGTIGRYASSTTQANAQGRIFTLADPQSIPQPNGTASAMVGQRWNFQCWHRDSFAGQPTSNFTNAVTIEFL